MNTTTNDRENKDEMVTVRWQEFGRDDRLVSKERTFKTEKAMQAFMAKQEQKDNFYQWVAWSR
jgi:hypothetical protein